MYTLISIKNGADFIKTSLIKIKFQNSPAVSTTADTSNQINHSIDILHNLKLLIIQKSWLSAVIVGIFHDIILLFHTSFLFISCVCEGIFVQYYSKVNNNVLYENWDKNNKCHFSKRLKISECLKIGCQHSTKFDYFKSYLLVS